MNNIKGIVAIILLFGGFFFAQAAFAKNVSGSDSLDITILSARNLNGIAGDYITIVGQITNHTKKPISDITTYLSMVDTENKLPVDLEDWSAEKGLYIGSIDAEQTLPLKWKIHFVKAGTYTLAVIANIAEQEKPIASSLTRFEVKPKKNLNPGQVLPVALGMPMLLLAFMAILQYRRSVKVSA
ncbi:MAG: hypothetical protein NTY10_04225 [Candidatus Omnitrophica bacterium]|nr:hypothetical protein [Candidatus Omnitrophota bacterium]